MKNYFYAIIEDNNDPLKMGRCRVRIVGLHPKSRVELPTNKLPWAIPILDFSSDINNNSYIPPVNGTPIVGFFESENMQNFFMIGTLPVNFSEIPDASEGFSDPNGVYPKRIGLTTNPLAVGDSTNDVITSKKNDLFQGLLFSEPETTYNAEYPYNRVYEDTAGNIIEIDATPEYERIHVYHKSGTFIEITNNGLIIKSKGESTFVVDGDCNIGAKGKINIESKSTVNIKANKTNVI